MVVAAAAVDGLLRLVENGDTDLANFLVVAAVDLCGKEACAHDDVSTEKASV